MKSVVLKISGESLISNDEIISEKQFLLYRDNIDYLLKNHYKILLIVGGGNIVRGRDTEYNRANIDRAGMFSTMINGLFIHSILEQHNYHCSIASNVKSDLIESFNSKLNSDITILVGGSGLIGFSTDILMILIAIELKSELVIKMTKARGVYDLSGENIYQTLSLSTMYQDQLLAIDRTAISLAIENNIQFYILHYRDNISDALNRVYGTYIASHNDDILYN